jgi:anti-sigma B factor antagonist
LLAGGPGYLSASHLLSLIHPHRTSSPQNSLENLMQTCARRHFVAQTAGPVALVTLTDRDLDDPNAHALGEELVEFTRHFTGSELCLDMQAVSYLSSTALGKFVTLNRKVKAGGGRLRLVGVDPALHELFRVTRLTAVLDVREREMNSRPHARIPV